jgi:hypothetical protein
MGMMIPSHEPVPDGRRFGADPLRIALFAMFACGVYGGGIAAVVWAAFLTMSSMRAGTGLPVLPWALAFVLVVSGMLAVIYGFFFRPRECRFDGSRIGLVYWDGNGKVMEKGAVESMEMGASRIVLRGGGKKLVVGSMFSDWKSLRGELAAWDPKISRGG